MYICDRLTASAKSKMKEEIFLSAQLRSERHVGFDEKFNPIASKQQISDGASVLVKNEAGTIGDFHVHPLLIYRKDGSMVIYPDLVEGNLDNLLEPNGADIHTNLETHLQFACIGTYHPIKKDYIAQCYELNYDDRDAIKELTQRFSELTTHLPKHLQEEVIAKRKLTTNARLFIINQTNHPSADPVFHEYLNLFGLRERFIKNRCQINLGKGKTNRWETESKIDWKALFHGSFKYPKWEKPER